MLEDKKSFDFNSFIGFALIALILVWMLYQTAPTQEELEEKARTEQDEKEQKRQPTETQTAVVTDTIQREPAERGMTSDSLRLEQLRNQLGSFAYSSTLPSATDEYTVLENDVLELKVSNKGGYIVEATLKQHKTHDSISIYLIKDGN